MVWFFLGAIVSLTRQPGPSWCLAVPWHRDNWVSTPPRLSSHWQHSGRRHSWKQAHRTASACSICHSPPLMTNSNSIAVYLCCVFPPLFFILSFFFKLWSKFVTFLYFFTYLFVIGIDEFLFLEILSCWLKRIGKMGKYWGKAGNREEEGSIVCTHISVIRSFFVVCVQVPGTTYKFQLIKSKIPKFIAYHPHPCEKSAHMWILFFSALTAETVVWHQCMLKDYEGLQTIKMVHKEQAFSITKGTKTLTEPFVETVFFAHHCYWLCWWAQRSGNSYLQS